MAPSYLQRQIASEQDSLALARRAYDGLLYDLWRELDHYINHPPCTPQPGLDRVEKRIEWCVDQRGHIDTIEATVDELQAELPL